ncbi:MAG: hypothetical protein IT200_06945 [Thermoleophilia bacterium]|nr:hypothetical protein [Thermoleophilia bacterium]
MSGRARERYRRDGLCVRCGDARHGASQHCLVCLRTKREECRRRNGWREWRPGKPGRPPLDRPRGDEREVA